MRELELRNAQLLAAWRAKLSAGATFPDAWALISRLYLEHRLGAQRLEARQWLLALKNRTRAAALAQERWFRRRKRYASSHLL
jgi:hypothetical protein